jgi:heparosan-N-sulfate-glucuronate 5-epimerase
METDVRVSISAVSPTRTQPLRSRGRWKYYRRIFSAYLTRQTSQLTFWHEVPEANPSATPGLLGGYYMPFTTKAEYASHLDANGVPMLDYRGALGLQYNPIAIAQYGLGNYNLFCRTKSQQSCLKFLKVADWLVANLELNRAGLKVWHHDFDWEYRTTLRAPWHSALAQGQGISVLVRAFNETNDPVYLTAAKEAFKSLLHDVSCGGVSFTDEHGDLWLEEYVVHPEPPTHILNGFIWATWGVYDYWLATGDTTASDVFEKCMRTLERNLHRFDAGFWSLYEEPGTRMRMLASPFYHRLHIVQLRVLHLLTGNRMFADVADRWAAYQRSWLKSRAALIHKSVFKLCYY